MRLHLPTCVRLLGKSEPFIHFRVYVTCVRLLGLGLGNRGAPTACVPNDARDWTHVVLVYVHVLRVRWRVGCIGVIYHLLLVPTAPDCCAWGLHCTQDREANHARTHYWGQCST